MLERYAFEGSGNDDRPDRKALRDRLKRMQTALAEERWLPMGLRSLLAHELPQLRKGLLSRQRSRRQLASQRVHELALTSYRYGPELLDSELVSQLRVLDLELNPSRLSSRQFEAWAGDGGDGMAAFAGAG